MCGEAGAARAIPLEGPCPSPPPGWTWEGLMAEAMRQADLGRAAGEVPVGAVLVSAAGELLAVAHNEPVRLHDPTAHAEVLAMRGAGRRLGNYRLDGCVLVVTLEPCAMCAAAAVHARLAGVVFGAADPRAGAVLSCMDGLELPFVNHHVWHMGGVASEDCARQLRDFFLSMRGG